MLGGNLLGFVPKTYLPKRWLRLFRTRFFASLFKRSCLPERPPGKRASVADEGRGCEGRKTGCALSSLMTALVVKAEMTDRVWNVAELLAKTRG
jgi:hypothetical protein